MVVDHATWFTPYLQHMVVLVNWIFVVDMTICSYHKISENFCVVNKSNTF